MHRDHICYSSVKSILQKKVPIYCASSIRNYIIEEFDFIKIRKYENLIKSFDKNEFSIKSFNIDSFEVPHDSRGGCFGFNIISDFNKEKKLSVATDLGYIPEGLHLKFKNSEFIILESNHDLEMLDNSKRSLFLKERIKKIGHLSNEKSAVFISDLIKFSDITPKGVMLAHISQQCNTNEKAKAAHKKVISELQLQDFEIIETYCSKPGRIIKI